MNTSALWGFNIQLNISYIFLFFAYDPQTGGVRGRPVQRKVRRKVEAQVRSYFNHILQHYCFNARDRLELALWSMYLELFP